MERVWKIILVIILGAVLFLPLLQHHFNIVEENPLSGSFNLTEKPVWSKDAWLSSDFQDQYETYIRDHIGFRNFFVRVHNQLQYSLFRKTTAKDVKIGRKGQLFEGGYIRDYLGINFIGKESIENQVSRLKETQIELAKEGVDLLVVYAPGKATLFPEYFPSEYRNVQKELSNYEYFVHVSKEKGLNHIDFNTYFKMVMDTSQLELFPKGGIHWGQYGLAIAYDSIAGYFEDVFDLSMVEFDYSQVHFPENVRDKDRDISDGMNLLFPYPDHPLPEPVLQFSHTPGLKRPRLLIVGDSFGSRILESPLSDELFEKVELWYYNRGIEPPRSEEIYAVRQLNVPFEVRQFDVVMLVVSETNMYKFDFGFVDGFNSSGFDELYEYYLQRIADDEEWMKHIEIQADKLNISIDSSLSKDARDWAEKKMPH